MTEHANLTAALVAAQAAFGDVKKDKTVRSGTYSYKYADLGQTLDAVMPALHSNGIAVVQPTDVREGQAGVITRLMHTSGESLEGWTPILTTSMKAQDMGSAITYARRYGLTALLCLAAEDDDGAAASKPRPEPREQVNQQTGEIHTEGEAKADKPTDPLLAGRKKMYATAKSSPLNKTDEEIKQYLLETFKVTSSKELDEGQLNVALQHFTRLKNQKLREQPVTVSADELGEPTF